MSNKLILGNISFKTNLIQGPLAGVSSAPFRELLWEYSNPAFAYTEMISCKTILYQKNMHKRFFTKSCLEGPVSFQLSGNNVDEISEAVKIVTMYGADLIDLNCGCPVNKIRSRGAGSALLKNPTQIYNLIRAMKNNTELPVSIKLRVDRLRYDQCDLDIINALNDSDVDFVTVHGRHWTQSYDIPCDYEQIKFFVEHLKMPVIGNGDVACINSLQKMLATGCSGVMVARATVGQPWLLAKLEAELKNEFFVVPSIIKTGYMLMQHIKNLSILLENEKFAVLQARKFAKYYARNLPLKTVFCDKINFCNSVPEVNTLIKQYFID